MTTITKIATCAECAKQIELKNYISYPGEPEAKQIICEACSKKLDRGFKLWESKQPRFEFKLTLKVQCGKVGIIYPCKIPSDIYFDKNGMLQIGRLLIDW